MGQCGTKLPTEHNSQKTLTKLYVPDEEPSEESQSQSLNNTPFTPLTPQRAIPHFAATPFHSYHSLRSNKVTRCVMDDFDELSLSASDSHSSVLTLSTDNRDIGADHRLRAPTDHHEQPNQIQIQKDSSSPSSPISVRFVRTLFCEDVTYEYTASSPSLPALSTWNIRLTVSQLRLFYDDTLCAYLRAHHRAAVHIPSQFGKVMKHTLFTSLLNAVLSETALLYADDAALSEATANLLCIPLSLRPLLQYAHGSNAYAAQPSECPLKLTFADSDFAYLCHRTAVYEHDNADYFEAALSAHSVWLRSMAQSVDVLLVWVARHSLFVVRSTYLFRVQRALADFDAREIGQGINLGDNDKIAWAITDFLPCELRLSSPGFAADGVDSEGAARVVYRFVDDVETSRGEFMDGDVDSKMAAMCEAAYNEMQQTDVDAEESLSERIEPSLSGVSESELTIEESEMEESPMSAVSDRLATTQCVKDVTPSTVAHELASTMHSVMSKSMVSMVRRDRMLRLRCFFGALCSEAEDGEGEGMDRAMDARGWAEGVAKLDCDAVLSSADITNVFEAMRAQNEEKASTVDVIDFMNWCSAEIKGSENEELKRTQTAMIRLVDVLGSAY